MWFSIILFNFFVCYFYLYRNYYYNSVTKDYNDFMSLKSSVQSVHSNASKYWIYAHTIKIVLIKKRNEFLHSLFGIVKKTHMKDVYNVSYYHSGCLYHIPIQISKGPKEKYQFFDENYNDITGDVKPYLGINNDFHKLMLTPTYLNRKKIIIRHHNIDYPFNGDERMILPKREN